MWIDGAMPFRAETIHGYLQSLHQQFLADPAVHGLTPPPDPAGGYRDALPLQSIVQFHLRHGSRRHRPATGADPGHSHGARHRARKELGSITNLYVTPVTRLEFLLGKQIPYIVLAFVDFLIMFLMALYIFEVPLKGGFGVLALGSLVYAAASTGYGMVVSAFTRTQIAALFGTAILTILPASMFSGLSTPASAVTGMGRIMGQLFPMTYYLPISVGAFTKGLYFADLASYVAILALFFPALVALSHVLLRKQEK